LFYNTGATSQTGDSMLAVYDFQKQEVLLSFAEYGTWVPAYSRPAMFLNMTQLFNLWAISKLSIKGLHFY